MPLMTIWAQTARSFAQGRDAMSFRHDPDSGEPVAIMSFVCHRSDIDKVNCITLFA